MGQTKRKLRSGQPALGGWIMIGHPAIAELMAGEGFDWIAVDLEHTAIDIRGVHDIALALKGSGVDLLARLSSCDPVQAKLALDAGADGIIVPSVDTPGEAARAAAMARYPPQGTRGASLSRATDYGRRFGAYAARHNDDVIVVAMLEHGDAVKNATAILSTPGVDATLIGPYDLSASLGFPGLLDHPEVQAAQDALLEACRAHRVPAGIHVVPVDRAEVERRIAQGFQFIACGIDTQFLLHGCRTMLGRIETHG